ncbi:MAG: glycosyltransferase family 39 protein [Thermoanaerobaculales bacterium]
MASPTAHPSPPVDATAQTLAPQRSHRFGLYLGLIALAVVVLSFGVGAFPLTDPDEVFYAQTAREMLAQKSLLTPLLFGHPQFEKPPLTYWLLMASFKVFGVHPWSARLVPALAGLLAAFAVYRFARRLVPGEIAALAALVQLTALACLGQSLALLTDMVFTALIAWSLLGFYRWFEAAQDRFLLLFAAGAGLAVMTKGPVAIIAELLAIVLFLRVGGHNAKLKRFLLHPWWAVFLVVAAPWYLWAAASFGRAFTWEFLVHDNWDRILRAEHTNFDNWGFYPAVMIVGMLPWTPLFAFLGAGWRKHRDATIFLLAWIGAVFAIFQLAHSKLPSYILPLFPAIALLLALPHEVPDNSPRRRRVAAALSILFGGVFFALPFVLKPEMAVVFRPTLIAVAVFGFAEMASGVLLLSRRMTAAIGVAGAGFLAFVLVAVTAVPPVAVHGFTEADLPALVAKFGLQGQPILSSKLHVRGAWYFTGNPVVVIDRRAHPFWSDHPLPVLWQDDQLRAFFASHDKVLCTIRPGDLERLGQLFADSRTTTVLSNVFDRVVVLSAKK